MNVDATIRTVAALAAAALVAAPFMAKVSRWAVLAWEAARSNASSLGRVAAAAILVGVATGHVPLPSLPRPVAAVEVETPDDEMKAKVAPIASALAKASMLDRMLWAEVWSKSATVVAGDAITSEVVFTDTRALRMFNVIALDIAWRRIGENKPGKYEGLKAAVESAFEDVIGLEIVPVTAEMRAEYVRLARAIAWAGLGKG